MIVFDYHGTPLATFNHLYNLTWLNERCVELAIAHWWLDQLPIDDRAEGLEVGNVLGHYTFRQHLVVDRDERAAWYQEMSAQQVANLDVLVFAANTRLRFPWIVSLSTLEHTGDVAGEALTALAGLLRPGGRMLVSWPCGANPVLDAIAKDVDSTWVRSCTFVRDGAGGWEPTEAPVVVPLAADGWADSVFVAEWEAPCVS